MSSVDRRGPLVAASWCTSRPHGSFQRGGAPQVSWQAEPPAAPLAEEPAARVVPAGRGAPGLMAGEAVDGADVEGPAGAVVGNGAVDGVGRVVGPDGGDDHAVVSADVVERGVEAGVERAGADVGALDR